MADSIPRQMLHKVSCLLISRVRVIQTSIQDSDMPEEVRAEFGDEIERLAELTAELAKADAAYQANDIADLARNRACLTNDGLERASKVLGNIFSCKESKKD